MFSELTKSLGFPISFLNSEFEDSGQWESENSVFPMLWSPRRDMDQCEFSLKACNGAGT